MKMKKCLSLVLAAAMTFTLASCGVQEPRGRVLQRQH